LNGMTFIRYALDQTKDYKVCISVLPLTTWHEHWLWFISWSAPLLVDY
jgi:hypothetical protein